MFVRPWRDLNPQSLAPETNALAIRPQGHFNYKNKKQKEIKVP